MMRRLFCFCLLMAAALMVSAQRSPDFAQKFMMLCKGDTTVTCVTVSPAMMEQLVKQQDDSRPERLVQALSKLKSARIVKAPAGHGEQADSLLKSNAHRFTLQRSYQDGDVSGAFYTRQNRRGDTVEFIMLHTDAGRQQLVIVNLTGNLDEEFLCFLYNNRSF